MYFLKTVTLEVYGEEMMVMQHIMKLKLTLTLTFVTFCTKKVEK